MRLRNKLLYGVGTNDANYIVSKKVDGKSVICKYYTKWVSMLARCYSDKHQKNRPSYIGCTVHTEWLLFSVFRKWMMKQEWKGKHLDKDILVQGNKIYSPSTCLFVSHDVNSLFLDSKSARGAFPQGVSFKKEKNKYESYCKLNGKKVFLGYFDDASLAHKAYKKFKYKIISDVATNQSEPLRSAMLRFNINEY